MDIPYRKVAQYYYDPSQPIGKGSFGTVYICHLENNPNTVYAIKVIPLSSLLEELALQDQVVREMQTLRQLEGEHIVRLIDVMRTKNSLYIVMDYCDGGEMELKLQRDGPMSEEEACSVIKQTAHAFVTIHKQDIKNSLGAKVVMMHRDIKPANILYSNGKVKLSDFGFAKIVSDIDQDIEEAHTSLNTVHYSSPQILAYEYYNPKCDIWSAGMVFYRMIFGGTPWPATSRRELLRNIKNKPLMFPKDIESETKELIRKMLSIDEASRPSWQEVYDHPALKNLKIEKLI